MRLATASTERSGHRAHVLPYFAFVVLTFAQGKLPWPWAPFVIYPLKTVVVAGLLWFFRSEYPELRGRFSPVAILAGLVIVALWVGLDPFYAHADRAGFDPTRVASPALRTLTIGFRVAGAVLVVPIFEELFFRSWLARWLIDPRFTEVALGKFTWLSFLATSLVFGLGHFEWLAGILTGFILHALVVWKKRLADAIVAHAVANLGLAAYVLKTGRWEFW